MVLIPIFVCVLLLYFALHDASRNINDAPGPFCTDEWVEYTTVEQMEIGIGLEMIWQNDYGCSSIFVE